MAERGACHRLHPIRATAWNSVTLAHRRNGALRLEPDLRCFHGLRSRSAGRTAHSARCTAARRRRGRAPPRYAQRQAVRVLLHDQSARYPGGWTRGQRRADRGRYMGRRVASRRRANRFGMDGRDGDPVPIDEFRVRCGPRVGDQLWPEPAADARGELLGGAAGEPVESITSRCYSRTPDRSAITATSVHRVRSVAGAAGHDDRCRRGHRRTLRPHAAAECVRHHQPGLRDDRGGSGACEPDPL